LLLVALALILARIIGYLFYKIKQPVVIGEILAGILLGGIIVYVFSGQNLIVLDYKIPLPNFNYSNNQFNPFYFLAELGILFLLFISGLEINIKRLKKMEKPASIIAIGGVIFPLILGFIAAYIIIPELNFHEAIAVGLILTATSVGVTVRALMDLGLIHTDISATILSSAVIDDVLGIILLALALTIEKSIYDVAWVGIKIVIFFLIFLILGLKFIDRILGLGEKINLPKAFLSISLAILLIYSFFADKAGISGIIGAFVAGVLIGQNVRSAKIVDEVKAIGYGLFIPIFFVWVGTRIWDPCICWEFSKLTFVIELSLILIVIGIIGKIIGCGIGAKIVKMTNKEALQIGIGMIPRMELALIIATAAVTRGFIGADIGTQIIAATIILTIVTTLIAPILIKASFKNEQ
jgi:Kef-type K+ transport system membrane component KefB